MAQVELVNVRGSRVFPNVPELAFTQGDIWHVKPYSGNDGNTGKRPDQALKTLSQAHTLATANQNDVVLLYAESNTASATTDYQSSTLTWSKDMVHLIGVGAPAIMSPRARIAFISTYVTASNLMTVSADGCIFANLGLFAGVADTHPTGCLKVTGTRNIFRKCHIAGIGNDSMDIAGAYSLMLDAAEEVLFDRCYIGLNTIDAGSAANSDILIDTATKNCEFYECKIYRRIEHATNHPLVKLADATAIDEFLLFTRCGFISTATNYAYTQGGVFKLAADLTQGLIILDNCYAVNDNAAAAGKWDVDDRDKICIIASPTPAADTAGLIRVV
jgi:hypothetical protein